MFNQFFGEEGAKRISRWTASALFFLSVFLVIKIIADIKKLPDVGKEVYPQSTISVSGTGEAYAIPDIAAFNFSVVETGDMVKQAQEKADAKINKALAAVREAGVEDRDIKTIGYNVYPKYEWNQIVCLTYLCPSGKQVLTGYEVSQTVTVKVRDMEKEGDLVTKIGDIGASNISGVEFTVDNRDQYVAQARAQAIDEAKTKAKELAKQLGVKLGSILYYNESGNYPIYHGMAEGKGGGDTAVSSVAPRTAELPQGETKITSDVSITYEIK